jgi:hypothetical protein
VIQFNRMALGTAGRRCRQGENSLSCPARDFGNLAVSLLSDAHLAFWTRTLWTDERSMRAFMFAPAHRAVMPKLLEWCDEAAVTHWLQETPEPPSWQEVHRRLQQEGRTSKVDHPSEAQMRFEIPPPKTTRQLTLKSPPHAKGLST